MVTAISERYVETLNNFLPAELQRLRIQDHELWFQHDSTTNRTTRISMAVRRRLVNKLKLKFVKTNCHTLYLYLYISMHVL